MLGLSLVALGQAKEALPHLRAAVAAEPGEAMFRYNLGRGLTAAGDNAGAVAEHAEAARLAPGIAALQVALAQAQLAIGRAAEARSILEKFGSKQDSSPAVTRLLVQARAGTGDTHAALDAARSLLKGDLAKVDLQGRADAMTAASLAHAAMHYDEAVEILAGLTRRDPADADAATVLAQLLLWTEGPEAARDRLLTARRAGALSPRLLVELLNHGAPVQAEVEAMAARSDLAASERADLLLALAQAADQGGDAARAWELAAQGKALVPPATRRDWRTILDRQLAIYRGSKPVDGDDAPPRHLYLLGTPRSGQSLLQSILAADPAVASAGERGALLQHLLFRDAEIAAMAATERHSLFRDLAAADRRGINRLVGTPGWVVDKSPLHLVVAGNIARVHPCARFAAVLRDPADVAISIWLRGFPQIYEYARDFGAILAHLDLSLDAIATWRAEGLDIRLLDFASFLADPAGSSADLFDWLGLDWRESYLDPANRTEPVPTYSAAQVRQAVGVGSSKGAAPYATQLGPYAETLDRLRAKQGSLFSHR